MPHVPLEQLTASPVTEIVSLGPRCATAFNLRRFFDFQTAGLFDWWITPPDALEIILARPDVEFLYNPANLSISTSRDTVIHTPTGILFNHEFPREWTTRGQPVVENYRDFIDKAKARSSYLLHRLLGIGQAPGRVLFVREGTPKQSVVESLEVLFPVPDWSVVWLGSPLEGAFGWKCDPAEWDGLLSPLGVVLERGKHKPFAFRSLHDEAQSPLV